MKLFRSIRWQIQFWQMLLLSVVLGTLLILYYHLDKKEMLAQVDRELQTTLMFIMPGLSSDLPENRPPPMQHREGIQGRGGPLQPRDHAKRVLNEALEEGKYVVTWSIGSREKKQYGDVPADLTFDSYQAGLKEPTLFLRSGNREIVFFHVGDLLVVVGEPLSIIQHELNGVKVRLTAVGTSILFIGFFIGWLITRRVLRPVQQISQTAKAIREGNSNERIELSDAPVEMADLAIILNQSFDHLDETIQIQKQFSTDASHELRTPIAVVIAQCQAALKRDRSTEEYKAVLAACLRAGERMKSMANSLLELTRIDSTGASLCKVRSNLGEVVREAVAEGGHLSERHPVSLLTSGKELYAYVESHRLHQVVLNLINNAVVHNPDGCAVRVTLEASGHSAVISIKDDGVGIPEDALPHIFERFYRVDKSRSRAQGGTGLGLAIVKKLVEAHGGSISVSSTVGLGTIFTIKLPGA